MSKRERRLNQRLEELFSNEPVSEAEEAASEPTQAPPAPAAPSVEAPAALEAAPPAMAPENSPPAPLRTIDATATSVIEQMPVPVYVKDREHNWVATNAAFCQRLGREAGALLGHVDKEQADEAWQLDDRVLDTGQVDESQQSIIRPDGSIRVVRTRRVPLLDQEQQVTGVMGIIYESITPREVTRAAAEDEIFHVAVEGMPNPMVISRTANDRILFANAAFSDLTGIPLEQIIGQPAINFYANPADREEVADIARRKGVVHDYETRMRTSRSGGEIWVNLNLRLLRFNNEACVITNVTDITARKAAEAELNKFKLGIDRTNAAVTITDAKGIIRYVNPAYERIYGYSPAEVIGQNPRILKSGYVLPDQYQRFWAKLLAGEPVTGEIINKAKDGHLVPVETNNTPIQDETGKTIGFLSIQYDISERKQAETNLRKFKLGLDRSTAALFITDPEGLITYVNPAFEKIYGYTAAEAIGQTPRIIKSGVISQEQYKYFWETLLAGQTVAGEIINKAKDGRLIPIEGSNNPILDDDGHIIGFLAMHTDITERKRAEAEREQLLKNEAKRALQLQTAAAVSNAASTILSLDELLPFVVDLIQERFGLYYVGLFLINRQENQADLRAATGEAGRQLLTLHQHLHLDESSMIGWSITHRQARIAVDVGDDAVRFSNPLLPDTRSEVTLPLISRGQVLGAMTAQSREPTAFTDQDVAVLQSLADQVANAIANAQLFDEAHHAQAQAEARLREVQFLQRVSQASSATLDPMRVYDVVFAALEQDMGFTHCALVIFNRQKDQALIVRASGTARGLQGLDRRISDLKDDILIDIANGGQTAVIDGWDERLDQQIYESQGHDKLVRAFVPLLLRGESVGLFEVGYQRTERERITPDEVRLLDSLANQIAIAVANAQLFEETERRVTEVSILNEISQAFTLTQSSAQLFETIHAQVGRLFDTRNFYIATYRGGNEWTSAYHIEDGVRQPTNVYQLGSGFTSHILRTGRPILIHALSETREFHQQYGLASVGRLALSWMGVPLLVSGQPVGVMGIQSYEHENLYHDNDLVLFSTIAAQATIALQNVQLLEEAHIRANELTALNDLSVKLAERLDVEQVLQEIYAGVSRLLDTTNFYIALYDAEHDEVSFPVNISESVQDLNIEIMPADQGLTGYIIRHQEPLLLNENIEEWVKKMGLAYVGGLSQSWLGVPMLLGDQVLGVMAVQSYTQARIYNQHDQDILSAIAGQAAISLQNARLFEQTQRQAQEAAAINAVLQSVVSQRADVAQILETAYLSTKPLIPMDAFIVALYDEQTHQLTYPFISDEEQRYPANTSNVSEANNIGRTILHGEPILIHRTPEELDQLTTGLQTGLGNASRPSASLLYIPMKSEDHIIGALSVQSYQPQAYTPRHIEQLTRLANQLTLALQNARLFTQIQSNTRQLITLNEFSQAVTRQLDINTIFETTYHYAQQLFSVDAFFIALYDVATNLISFPFVYDAGRRYTEAEKPLRPSSRTGTVLTTGQPLLILETAESLAAMSEVEGALGDQNRPSASLLYVPLRTGVTTLGVLSVQSYQLNAYHEEDVQLLSTIGTQVAATLQTARLFQQTQQIARREQALREITARVRNSTDPDAIVRTAVRELGQVLGRSTFIRLGAAEQLTQPPAASTPLAAPQGDE